MNLQNIDWLIFVGLFIGLNLIAYLCRKLVKGVADFLVAGRTVGRYLGLETDAMAGLGAVSIMAFWQMNYKSGFVGLWWYMLTPLAGIIVAITGFGVYRFRQSRAMTIGQFIEMRYSKRARIFAGCLAYLAGVLNMGIFPAAGAGFFIYYCGFPPEITIAGMQIPIILPVMILLVGSAVAICFFGGQVTLVITNFIQGVFVNVMLISIMVVIFRTFTWDQFAQAFQSASNSDALLHPFHSEGASEFNKWFFLIFCYWMFYWVVSWSPSTMQVGSARDAHEARMMRTMVEIKKLCYIGLGIMVLPLAAFVLMHHPDFAAQASQVNQTLDGIANAQIRSQMLTPAALAYILPVGLLGAFAGVILFAFISTHDSYLLAWGGLLIQDVIIPLRGRPLPPKKHLMLIRISVLVVAVFIVLFSFFFNQVDNIFMFFDVSASLWIGPAGAVMLGGLYWKRGTAKAAWATMIVGAVAAISSFTCRIMYPEILDGRIMAFWVSIICIVVYVTVSLLDKSPRVDLDEVLNRKKTRENPAAQKRKWFQWPSEVPKGDRILIPCIVIAIVLFLTAFIGSWIYNTVVEVPTERWLNFWQVYLYSMFALASAFLVWILIGGIRNLVQSLRGLKAQKVDEKDDGSVKGHHAAG